jgi:hypothetical protein
MYPMMGDKGKKPKKPERPQDLIDELEGDRERLRVIEWRELQLKRAGLDGFYAYSIARGDTDLEYACKTVKRILAAGDDPFLAVRILT